MQRKISINQQVKTVIHKMNVETKKEKKVTKKEKSNSNNSVYFF